MKHIQMFLPPLCVALCFVNPLPAADMPQGERVEGEPFRGELQAVGSDWKFEFSADAKRHEVAGEDLIGWGRPVDPAAGMQVLLAGGGLIVTDKVHLEGDALVGASTTLGKWSLPIDLCAGIVLRPPATRIAADRLRGRVRSAKGRDDRLLLDNGDELKGTITALSETVVTLRGTGEQLEVKLDTLAAVVFDPSLVAQPRANGLRAIVGLNDGSWLFVGELVADRSNAKLKLLGGGELQTATSWIVFVQMLGGRVTYLSDLEPASYRHIPLLELTWPFHNDRSVDDTQLRAEGRPYFKGLGMHSPARLTYELDDEYERFDADVAVDETAGGRGSVAFRVFVDDGNGGWQERTTSPIVRGGDAPRRVSADVRGAKRLSLLVDFADRGDELDHADWLNARLTK